MSGEIHIHGKTTLTFADQFAFHRIWIGWFLLIFTGLVVLIFTPLWFYRLQPWQWAVLQAAPGFMAKEYMRQIGFFAFGGMAFFIVFILLIDWINFGNLPDDNKKLTYTINEKAIETSDAANVALTMPWSMIKQISFGPKIIVIKTKARVTRWMPTRAFNFEDQAVVAQLASDAGVKVIRRGKPSP